MTVPPQDGWRPDHDQPAGPSQPPPTVNGLKWLLIAVAVLLVVGISVGATLIVTRGGKGAATKPALSDSTSDIASANDTGPVSIITDEPTCQSYMPINNSIADAEANGWGAQRSALGPASEWTPDQRSRVQAVASAIRNGADQVVPLKKKTPHRVVRELYEQFIVYGRAYVDSLEKYTPEDNALASTNVNAGSALAGICNAITYGSAARSLGVPHGGAPAKVAIPANSADPQRLISSSNPTCTEWIARESSFTSATPEWAELDTGITGSQWTPDQRALQNSAVKLLTEWANDMETAGSQSGNPPFEDFASTAALYIRAYVPLGENYIDTDAWLIYTAFRISNMISGACRAVAK